jgi:hypothetical protein
MLGNTPPGVEGLNFHNGQLAEFSVLTFIPSLFFSLRLEDIFFNPKAEI